MNRNNSKVQNCVSPAKAGIQLIKSVSQGWADFCPIRKIIPRKRSNIAVWPFLETRRQRLVLSASQGVCSCWIRAFAGITVEWIYACPHQHQETRIARQAR